MEATNSIAAAAGATPRRELLMQAVAADLQARYPDRLVLRGRQDPGLLGDAKLRRGVYAVVAEGTEDWLKFLLREAEYGTTSFVVVAYTVIEEKSSTEEVERAEAVMEDELLQWCQAAKAPPLDAVYPRAASYSTGVDHPVGWLVMRMEADYV
jgi:hypothetical protein